MNKRNRKWLVLFPFLALAIFLLWAIGFIYQASFIAMDGLRYYSLFDDAMISMRYAWNFSHGHGLVWNPGERVEGYTNLLMVLFMAIPNLFLEKRLATLAIQIMGIITMIVSAFLIIKITFLTAPDEDRNTKYTLAFFAALGILFYYPLQFWTLMGMETGLLALLLLAGLVAYYQYRHTKRPIWLVLLSIFLGFAFLTRPDSLLPSLAILVLGFLLDHLQTTRKKSSFIVAIAPIVIFFLFPLAQLLFRVFYYGEMVPNTYTLKVGGVPLDHRLTSGFDFVARYLETVVFLIVVSCLGLIVKLRRSSVLFLTLFFVVAGYQIFVGGDAWAYWRIMAPVTPLLVLVLIRSSNDIISIKANDAFFMMALRLTVVLSGIYLIYKVVTIENARFSPGIGPADTLLIAFGSGVVLGGLLLFRRYTFIPRLYQRLAQILLIFGIAFVSINFSFLPELVFRVKPYTVVGNTSMVNKAIAISEITNNEASVGVIWAGTIPYYTGLEAIDFLGKSDIYVASLEPDLSSAVRWFGISSPPGHNKYDLFYSIGERQPTFVQSASWGTQNLSQWIDAEYIEINYKGVQLTLKNDDPGVQWDELRSTE